MKMKIEQKEKEEEEEEREREREGNCHHFFSIYFMRIRIFNVSFSIEKEKEN